MGCSTRQSLAPHTCRLSRYPKAHPWLFLRRHSIHPHRRPLRQPAEGPHAADAVPGIGFVGLFALPFVALQEAGDEEFFGERVELYAAGLAVVYDFEVIVRIDHFRRGPR